MKKFRSERSGLLYPILCLALSAIAYGVILYGGSTTLLVLLFLQPFLYVIASEASLYPDFIRSESDRIGVLLFFFIASNCIAFLCVTMFLHYLPVVRKTQSTVPTYSNQQRMVQPKTVQRSITGTITYINWDESMHRREIYIDENGTVSVTYVGDATIMQSQGVQVFLNAFTVEDIVTAYIDDSNTLVRLEK